jgi:membrane-associated phospholipid phosphatase
LRRLVGSSGGTALGTAVRAAAVIALGAAVVVPLVRRRYRIPPAVTIASVAAGPVALAVLTPRTKARDAGMFGLQMWAFTMAHELPYDDPERLRARLRVRYPIRVDWVIGGGELPGLRLQHVLSRPGRVAMHDRVLTVVHWAWFFQPHLSLLYVLVRHEDDFARAARQMAGTFDLGCLLYYLVPTAPPWWAAEQGYLDGELERKAAEVASADSARVDPSGEVPPALRRIMVDVGEGFWGRAWPTLYDSLGGNPWAAMPSLHLATSLMAAILLAESEPAAGWVGWGYAITLGFALVYLGEHYVTDLVAGAALVAGVRLGEPVVEPLALRASEAVQRLERLANG